MTPIREILLSRIKQIIDQWSVEDQYAISFFVYTNEAYEYGDYSNVPYFAISYNTESQCDTDDPYGEERWNYAFWPQNESVIIDTAQPTPETEHLFSWYRDIGLENIGFEDPTTVYDEHMHYIGKGPVGLAELLEVITDIAEELQQTGYIEEKFGKKLPIIIHDLEYIWYMIEATRKANKHGEADVFLQSMHQLGFYS
ncbi:MAG: hypothetical protein IJD39_10655 [Clostridia bacterium]|nr:hypothetical protein [Clostridia bacterium]